jgi:hypothetical protein
MGAERRNSRDIRTARCCNSGDGTPEGLATRSALIALRQLMTGPVGGQTEPEAQQLQIVGRAVYGGSGVAGGGEASESTRIAHHTVT